MEEIINLIAEKKFSLVTEILDEINSVDIANFLETLDNDRLLIVFRLLKTDSAAEVFPYVSPEKQREIIESASDKEITSIVNELFIDDTVDIIEAMPANVVKKILRSAKPEKRELINKFLRYPDKSAGSIMTPEYLDLREGMTIEQALARIRKIGEYKETINVCYVTDPTRRLKGVVSIKDLLLAQPDTKVDEIMTVSIVSVDTHTPQEEASHTIRKYDLISLPVVDGENRIVGIITIDDILDVIDDDHRYYSDGLYSDAYGHGRQRWESGVRHRHTRHCSRRGAIQRHVKGNLEGTKSVVASRHYAVSSLLRKAHAHRQAVRRRKRLPHCRRSVRNHARHRRNRKNHRLHSAVDCKKMPA